MYSHIIFDFDGTIGDTHAQLIAIAKELEIPGIDTLSIEQIRDMGARKALTKAGIRFWQLPFLAAKIHKLQRPEEIEVFYGMLDIIHELAETRTLGIVSSNSTENIVVVLEKHGIRDKFDIIEGNGSLFGKHRKLKTVLRHWDVEGKQVVYVGDEDRDVMAAKKVGIHPISVTWGLNSEKRLCTVNPDAVVSTPNELREALK